MAWYAAGSVRTRAALLRGLWLEKAVLGASITAAHLAGWVPPAGMGLNVLVNLAWVPVYMYADAALRTKPSLTASGPA